MSYRLKATVEATQLTNSLKALEKVQNSIPYENEATFKKGKVILNIEIPQEEDAVKTVTVNAGDWLVQTDKGLEILTNDEFIAKYEKVIKRKSRAKVKPVIESKPVGKPESKPVDKPETKTASKGAKNTGTALKGAK